MPVDAAAFRSGSEGLQRWSLNALARLHWRDFDTEWLAFDVASGHTHWLEPLSAAVLMCFQEGPAGLDEITAFARSLGAQDSEELHQKVTEIVSELLSMGLVETARS